MLQLGDEKCTGQVKRRALRAKYDMNLSLKSIIYEIEFADGQTREYSANVENMLAQVVSVGYSPTMMEGVVNYRKDEVVAVPKEDRYFMTKSGQCSFRATTDGWDLLV